MSKTSAIMLAAVAALVATTAFAVTYRVRGTDPPIRAGEPPPGADTATTPVPGVTPDASRPESFLPYVDADNAKPRFVGELNGFTIDPSYPGRTSKGACPPGGFVYTEPAKAIEVATSPGPMRVDPAGISGAIISESLPESWSCRGELAQVVWNLRVNTGTEGVGPAGALLMIHRIRGLEPIQRGAPEERWTAATVAGSPAVVASPILAIDGLYVGECYVAVYQPLTDVLTEVLATRASAEFCLAAAEAIVR